MKTLCLAAFSSLSLLIFIPAHAQMWRDAVITFNRGDSLKGQIEYLDESVSTASITFRQTPEGEPKTYTTNDVSSYKILKPVLVFGVIEADINHYNKFPVAEGDNPIVEREHIRVFGEVMFRSAEVTLYSLVDKTLKERLFVKHHDDIEELINVKYRVEKAGGAQADVERSEYVAQVKSIVSDCPPKKRSFNYSSSSLIKVFQEYAICKHGSVEFTQADAGNDVRVGLSGWTGYGNSKGEKLGIDVYSINVQVLPRKNNNRFIWVELGYMIARHKDAAAGSKSYTNKNVSFGAYVGSYFGHGKLQPLFYAGASSGLLNAQLGIGLGWRKSIVLGGGVAFVKDYPVIFNGRLSIFPRFFR